MNPLRQIIAVTALSLGSFHTRVRASLIVAAGLAAVIVAMLFFLTAEFSIKSAYKNAGDPGRAFVLSVGAAQERNSTLSRGAVNLITDAPGIARGPDGAKLVDAQLHISISPQRKSGKAGYAGLLGFGPKGFVLRPELKLVSGRLPRPGRREVIVGVAARDEFTGLDIGGKIAMPDGEWPVVGIFSAGSFYDGYLIADSETLMAASRRKNFNSVVLRLDGPGALPRLQKALTGNPALSVTVKRESDYWQRQFDSLPPTAIVLVYLLGILMGAGAVSGILQTMYAAVSARQNEIAILRALGFDGFAVAASVVLEAMLLVLLGAGIGMAIASYWFGGIAYNGAYGVFRMMVGAHAVLIVTGWAMLVAFAGSISPAIKAARITVTEGLRQA